MLMPAILYKDQIEELIKERLILDPNWFMFLNMFPSMPVIPEIASDDWTEKMRVSVCPDGVVQGMIKSSICRLTNTVENISTWSRNSTLFALDLKQFLESLLSEFDLVRFSAVKDAPTDAMWTSALSSMNVEWSVAGVFRRYARLSNGKIVDVKWFEVMRTDRL